MADNQNISFENELYSFLYRALNNPAMLKSSSGELKTILYKLRHLKPEELEAVLNNLRALNLIVSKFNNNVSAVIEEIERNVSDLARKGQAERAKVIREINSISKAKTADKAYQAMNDYIRG